MLFICLLVLASLQRSIGLICKAGRPLTISRSKFLSMDEADLVRMIDTKTWNSIAKFTACHITMTIDYHPTTGNVSITFGKAPYGGGDHSSIVTRFPLDKQRDSIVSEIDFVCSTVDRCDRTFLIKWVPGMVNTIYETYKYGRNDSSAASENSDKSYVLSKSVYCPSGECIASYDLAKNRAIFRVDCMTNDSIEAFEGSVRRQAIRDRPMRLYEREYIRMMDECNSEAVFNQIRRRKQILPGHVPYVTPWFPLVNRAYKQLNPSSYASRAYYLPSFTERAPVLEVSSDFPWNSITRPAFGIIVVMIWCSYGRHKKRRTRQAEPVAV